MSALLKSHYTCAELSAIQVPGLPTTKAGIAAKADRECWPYLVTTGVGGSRREYAPPVSVIDSIRAKLAEELVRAGLPGRVVRREEQMPLIETSEQALKADARKGVLNALELLMARSGYPMKRAATVLIDTARLGSASDQLVAMLKMARDERGRKSVDGLPSVRSLLRFVEYERAGMLAPKRRERDMSVPEWAPFFMGFYQRPEKPTVEHAYHQFRRDWIPQQMALAKTAGMSGLKDFGNLVVANQAAVITAGTKDEAGNNVVNLLEKLNSADTQIKAKKLGIDLTGSLASSREKGVNALDAFVGIVENVMAKDKRYQQNRAKLAKAPEGERKEILESQASLLEGTSIGKLIHDRQALGGLVAYMGQKEYRQQVAAQVFDPKTAVDGNFDLITGTASFKAEQLGNESAIAKQGALAGLNDSIGDASTKLTEYARKYPDLAVAIEATTLGLKAATASLGVFAAATLLRGGVGTAAGAGAASGGAAAAGALGAGASFGARFATIGKAVGRVGAPLAVAAGGLEAYMIANDNSKTADEKKAGYVGVAGGVVGGLGGMAAGAAAGAAVGSVVPVLGTAVGLVGGAIAGYFGHEWGEKLGKSVGDAIFAHKKDDKPPVVESHVSLYLDGEQLANVLAVSGQKEARRN